MSAAVTNPRRRPARPGSPTLAPSLVDSFQQMSLRKGETFQNIGAGKTELWNPLDSNPSLPIRSTTCPKSLEDLLLGAGERRAADLLARVDKAIATNSKLALESVLSEPDVLPALVLDSERDGGRTEQRQTRPPHARHSHSYDSGLGSSIASSADLEGAKLPIVRVQSPTRTVNRRSLSEISAVDDNERGLSNYAAQQIHKHIVKPILAIETLKEFHPLIRDVPYRIGKKEIKNLRDLEKTLIFLAPDYSRSPLHYLRFCERTVRVLHTTVTTLHESDQKAPADRPYTQGYFLDLVEQIRRYATILQATREKQAKGEELDEMDYDEDERITIRGGMTHTGEPAELVRIKNGKTISISTGQELPPEDLATAKRPMTDAFADNDEALRSMARRKKNAPIEIHECPACDKEFKRPCDLTKHIKTHERPWKCPDETCKFHEHGWPTEKERDRHVNDKHSNAPALYHCLYKPCPYTSKRESNCKQHMEKAHGWEYVRSKNNGKGKSTALRLPHGTVPPSPASALLTPLTPIAPSPSTHSWSTSERHDSIPPVGMPGPSNYGTPYSNAVSDFSGHFNMDFDFNNMQQPIPNSLFPITPAMSEERRFSSSASSHSGGLFDANSFTSGPSPQVYNFDNFDFGDFAMPPQPSFVGKMPINNLYGFNNMAPYASPGAQLDQTMATSAAAYDIPMEDGFEGLYSAPPNGDFELFGTAGPSSVAPAAMFQSLDNGMRQNWGEYAEQYDAKSAPHLQSGDSAIAELFPELK